MSRWINEAVANRIYDILIRECGATEYWRQNFIVCHCVTPYTDGDSVPCREYRFQGQLGFGGKFRNHSDRWYVDYSPEDKKEWRDAFVEIANRKLQQLWDESHDKHRVG